MRRIVPLVLSAFTALSLAACDQILDRLPLDWDDDDSTADTTYIATTVVPVGPPIDLQSSATVIDVRPDTVVPVGLPIDVKVPGWAYVGPDTVVPIDHPIVRIPATNWAYVGPDTVVPIDHPIVRIPATNITVLDSIPFATQGTTPDGNFWIAFGFVSRTLDITFTRAVSLTEVNALAATYRMSPFDTDRIRPDTGEPIFPAGGVVKWGFAKSPVTGWQYTQSYLEAFAARLTTENPALIGSIEVISVRVE